MVKLDVNCLKAVPKHALIPKHGMGCVYLTVIPSGKSAFIVGKM